MTASDVDRPASIEDLTGDYQLDPAHTRIYFVARHAMVTSVRGYFHEFDGRLHLDAEKPEASTAHVTNKVAGLDTGQEQRDAHLRSLTSPTSRPIRRCGSSPRR
jgi:polyisoprenoid-binding protein YceI